MSAVPWVVIGVVALAIGAVFFVRWRRRRNEQLAAEWLEYQKTEAKKSAKSGAGQADPH